MASKAPSCACWAPVLRLACPNTSYGADLANLFGGVSGNR